MPITLSAEVGVQGGCGRRYALRVDLVDVCEALREHVARHLVAVLVSELSGFGAGTGYGGAGVGDAAGHDAADGGGEREDVGDGGGVEELVLCLQSASFPAGWKIGRRTGTFFCEMTTAQSLPRMPSEVMLAAVMALKAYSDGGVSGGAGWSGICEVREMSYRLGRVCRCRRRW